MTPMVECQNCQCPMCEYTNEGFTESICWNCGKYLSNSPAFVRHPDLFRDIVRKNPLHYMKKFLRFVPADGILQRKPNDEDLTEPLFPKPEAKHFPKKTPKSEPISKAMTEYGTLTGKRNCKSNLQKDSDISLKMLLNFNLASFGVYAGASLTCIIVPIRLCKPNALSKSSF